MRGIYGYRAYIFAIGMLAGSLLSLHTAYAQEQEFKEHIVSRGETLWIIATKEIVDPFLWPKIWKENPEVKNPDLIYPGQKIRIPLYLVQKEVAPQPRGSGAKLMPESRPETGVVNGVVKKGEEPSGSVRILPVGKEYLVDMDALVSSGYIADSLEGRGEMVGAPSERSDLGKDDYAYVTTTGPSQTGDKFYLIRSAGKVIHPETGAMMGYLIDVVGIAEVTGKESGLTKVKITASFSDVRVGDILSTYYEMDQPFVTEKPKVSSVKGFIVATKERRITNAQFSVVYIDRGIRDGVEVGDIMNMTATNRYAVPNGSIQIIAVRERTATAVVRTSPKEVQVGDKIGAL